MSEYFQLLINIGLLALIFSICFYFINRNKKKCDGIIFSLMQKLEQAEAKEKNYINKLKISDAINIAFNSTQLGVDEFRIEMKNLASVFRDVFKSEFCAIGEITNEDDKSYFLDIAVDYEVREDCEPVQKEAIEKINKVELNNPFFFVTDAFVRKEKIVTYEKRDSIFKKIISRNNNYKTYIQEISVSKSIKNVIILKIDNSRDNVGYVQLINSDAITEDSLKQFSHNLSELISFSIKTIERDKSHEETSKLSADINFINGLILEKKDDFDQILQKVMIYLSTEFSSPIISFRIPILNGKEKDAYFYLRKLYVDNTIITKREIVEFYNLNREIVTYNNIGGSGFLKCYQTEELIIGDFENDELYKTSFLPDSISKTCVVLPVLKEVDNEKCLKEGGIHCEIDESSDCKIKYENLFGVFKLRLTHNHYDNTQIQNRLKNISFQLSLLFGSIIDKKTSQDITLFRSELNRLNFSEISGFDSEIVKLLKSVTHSKVCSIFRIKKGPIKDSIKLSATTSKQFINLLTSTIFEVDNQNIGSLEYQNDGNNIMSRVYESHKSGELSRSKYLYKLKNPSDLNDGNYLKKHFPNFIELPIDYLQYDSDKLIKSIQDESCFILPMLTRSKECIGLILLLGKERDKLNISTSYWEQDRIFIEFVLDVMSRFDDANDADKNKQEFLSQFGHELLTPLNEIVYSCDGILGRYNIDKSIFKEILIKTIHDNQNSAILFRNIIDNIEFGYRNSGKFKLNIRKNDQPKNVFLNAIKLLENRGHIEGQISIVPSLSEMPPIHMDDSRILQVMINLIMNAIQYSDRGTTIEILYKRCESNSPVGKVLFAHEIIVANRGIGILEEDRERIFELNRRGVNAVRKRPDGTGIGLYIVKSIMKAHGGDCFVKKLKDPTEISILLPIIKS
jgi:signal transduction histidine kinase